MGDGKSDRIDWTQSDDIHRAQFEWAHLEVALGNEAPGFPPSASWVVVNTCATIVAHGRECAPQSSTTAAEVVELNKRAVEKYVRSLLGYIDHA